MTKRKFHYFLVDVLGRLDTIQNEFRLEHLMFMFSIIQVPYFSDDKAHWIIRQSISEQICFHI